LRAETERKRDRVWELWFVRGVIVWAWPIRMFAASQRRDAFARRRRTMGHHL
jgi:hypothetical protein